MTSLIACLGDEKATIAHVAEVIKQENWEKIFLISENKASGLFSKNNIEFILIDLNKHLGELAEEIRAKLEGKINDLEIAFNIVSGSGKMHQAVLSALLKLGLGIRLIALTPNGVREV